MLAGITTAVFGGKPVVGPSTQQTIYLLSGSLWTVPADWTSGNNSIECIGGGGNGSRGSSCCGVGGGGGAYSKKNNVTLTPGSRCTYSVSAGGGGSTSISNATGTVLCSAAGGANG